VDQCTRKDLTSIDQVTDKVEMETTCKLDDTDFVYGYEIEFVFVHSTI
jgi:hypothetical protein